MGCASKVLRVGLSALALAGGASAKVVMYAQDAVAVPGQLTTLRANIEHGIHNGMENLTVHFYVNGVAVGKAVTDGEGFATARCSIPEQGSAYEARARVRGRTQVARGDIFRWTRDKTILAVDIDETISHTNYSDLFVVDLKDNSKPLRGSAEILKALAKDYQLVYISARPHWLFTKSKRWLAASHFPPGPVMHAEDGFSACFKQAQVKTEILAKLRKEHPNLLIGIGDKRADDDCFGDNRMMALIIGKPLISYRPHCIVVNDWEEIGRFFAAHGQILAQPSKLAAAMRDSGMRLATYFERAQRQQAPTRTAAAPPPRAPHQPSVNGARLASAE